MSPEFYYSADAPYVKILSFDHIIFLLFCFFVIYLFVKNRQWIRAKQVLVSRVFLGVLLFQQIFLMYGWYVFVAGDLLSEGLPLHLCRISSLLTTWFLFKKDTRILDVIFYFSIYALISLFYPLEVYHFCHVNGVSYMINHLMTVLIPVFGAIAYDWKPGWKAFLRASIAFSVYLPVVIVVNHLVGGNYFYLVRRPFMHSAPAWLFDGLAYLVTIVGFAVVTLLVDLICKWFKKWQQKTTLAVGSQEGCT